jgi:hypothetical protein
VNVQSLADKCAAERCAGARRMHHSPRALGTRRGPSGGRRRGRRSAGCRASVRARRTRLAGPGLAALLIGRAPHTQWDGPENKG